MQHEVLVRSMVGYGLGSVRALAAGQRWELAQRVRSGQEDALQHLTRQLIKLHWDRGMVSDLVEGGKDDAGSAA